MNKIISDTVSARERFQAGCWVHSSWRRRGSGWSRGGLCMRKTWVTQGARVASRQRDCRSLQSSQPWVGYLISLSFSSSS